MSVHAWFLRSILLPAGDLYFKQGMMKRLEFLEQAQWWDAGRTALWRDQALRKLVQVCYDETPFYKQRMDEAGVKPRDIRTVADLRLIPVTTKEMMRDGYPDAVVRETGLPSYETSTSGSTGKLFTIREDSETGGSYRSSFMLSLEWAGWNIGEAHMMAGVNYQKRSLDRRVKDSLLRCHYLRSDDLTDDRLDAHLDALAERGIQHLWGYPGLISYVARGAERRGLHLPMKSIVTWGENLHPSHRELLEGVFGTRVTDTYGCGEGFQIAAQCGHENNYHTHDLDVVVEYLDDDGNPVPAGSPGHVTITRFHPGPMPFLRYQPGDLATASTRTACPCGRAWGLLKSIQGRATDTVITPSGNRIVGHIFNLAIKAPEIDSYQVVQDEKSSITVRVLLRDGCAYSPALEGKLIDNLRRNGADLEIRIVPVDEMPVPASGKHRFVLSRVRE